MSKNSSALAKEDEGYYEVNRDISQLLSCSPDTKTGLSLKPHHLSKIINKFAPLTNFDIVSTLPMELQFLIFQHLPYADLLTCAKVSKSWHNAVTDDFLWKKLFLSQYALKSNPNKLPFKYLYKQKVKIHSNFANKKYKVYSLDGHSEGIYCLQFNNNYIVSGSRDTSIILWDTKAKRKVHQLRGHLKSVLCVQFNSDMIISGSSDFTMNVWDMNEALAGRTKIVKRLMGHKDSVLNLRFDDKILISASKDKTLKVWNLKNFEMVKTLFGHMAAVNSVMFDDKHIVSASGDRTIRVWDRQTGECLREMNDHLRGIACIWFEGDHIVSGSSDKSIKLWNIHKNGSGLVDTVTKSHTDLVRSVCMNMKRNIVVSGSYDSTVKIWNTKNDMMQMMYCINNWNDRYSGGSNSNRIFKLMFNDERIVIGSQDRKLTIIDFTDGADDSCF